MLNPYVLLALVVGWGASVAGAGYWAYGAGQNKCIAEQARDAAVAQIASEAAAEAISKIEVKHTTVRQTLEKEIHERTVFRDCRSGPDAVRLFNSAIPEAQQGASSGELPASNPTK
jgi:hypothetical protein